MHWRRCPAQGKLGGEVIALTMGPPKAEAHSAESPCSRSGQNPVARAFGGSDAWATSYALAKAIEKIGDVDLVI